MGRTLVITTTLGAAVAMVAGAVVLLAVAFLLMRRSRHRAITQATVQATAQAAAARARLLIRLDHELKNPLTALQTAAASTLQLIAGGPARDAGAEAPRDTVADAAKTIGSSSRRIARLLADLRKLADIETREIDGRPVDIAAMLQLVADDARTAPGAEDRTINVSVPRAPWPIPHVRGDEDLLHTALLNLVTNALKYSGPDDTVEVRAGEDRGGWVSVDVADTGRGISADDQLVVWDELSRGGDVRAIPGSGMGLALVKAVVQRHGGSVELRSRPGEGTSVRVLLPSLEPAA